MKLALILAVSLIPGPMLALEQTAHGFILTQEEQARCAAGGGCLVVPQEEMKATLSAWLKRAFDAGRAEACRGT